VHVPFSVDAFTSLRRVVVAGLGRVGSGAGSCLMW